MNQWQLDEYNRMRLNQEIELMGQAIISYEKNKPAGWEYHITVCKVRIYKAALTLGDFDLALEYCGSRDEKKFVARLAMAMIREEKECCKCTPDAIPTAGGFAEIPMLFKWNRVFNTKINAWVDVYKCSKCNFMTAHPYGTASQSARHLERTRANPEFNSKRNPLKDTEALRK